MLNRISYRPVFNKSGRLNKQGLGLIEIECRQHLKRFYVSTHTYVRNEEWCAGQVINHPIADEINYSIREFMFSIQKIELDYLKRGTYISLAMLKIALRDKIKPTATLIEFGREIVSSSNRKKSTMMGYETLFNNIEKYRPGILVSDVDYNFIVGYDKWQKDGGIAQNTIIGRLCQLKTIMNEAMKRKIIDENPFDNYKIPSMTNRDGFLSRKMLRDIENLETEDKSISVVKDVFLFACYTGLRFSDIVSLKNDDVDDEWIHKKMVKTGFYVDIPYKKLFDGKAFDIIKKYRSINSFVKKIGCNATVNKKLKDIFEMCGIGKENEFTFHTARHTCASLLIEDGVKMETIQKILGHKKISTTQIYGKVTRDSIMNELMK